MKKCVQVSDTTGDASSAAAGKTISFQAISNNYSVFLNNYCAGIIFSLLN